LIVGEDELDLLAAVGVERVLRRVPAEVYRLAAVGPRLGVRGGDGEEEVRVVAGPHLGRRDPAREAHERAGVGQRDAGLLGHLPHAGRLVFLGGVDGAAREHPRATHEACRGVAPHEQHLERRIAAAQQDHGCGLARLGRPAGVELLTGRRTVDLHGCEGTLDAMTTTTVQRWICESCGFIYDPAEGDPDGGIPPGTAFDDIPSDWFCPVCGARKADFSPYED
jgi:rubredoxin